MEIYGVNIRLDFINKGETKMKKVLCLIATAMMIPTFALAGDPAPSDASKAAVTIPVSIFNLSLGGFVRLDYAYNSVNLGPDGWWSPSKGVPSTGTKNATPAGGQDQSIFSSKATRLWVKSTGQDFLGGKTSAIVEADFNGDASSGSESPQPRLRLAKADIKWDTFEVLFGEDWDIFGPMVAASLDFRNGTVFGTPNSQRVPQIRVTKRVDLNDDNAIRLVLGVQDPSQQGNNSNSSATPPFTSYGPSVNVAGQLSFISKSIGTAPGFYGLSMRPFTATLFGLYGTEKAPSNNNASIDSYGYGIYTFVPVIASKDGKSRSGSVSFEGQVYGAANMAFNSATSGTVIGNPAALSITSTPTGDQSPAQGYGYAAQIIAYPTQDLGVTVGYGSRRARNFSSYSGIADYQRSNSSFYANVAYDCNANVRVATEYQNLNTVYGNANGAAGAKAMGSDNTIRLVATYFF
jgi:hypothetical protein